MLQIEQVNPLQGLLGAISTRKQSEMVIADQPASRQVIEVNQTTPELHANQDRQHRRLYRALAQRQQFN
jgi:hypothetical protein